MNLGEAADPRRGWRRWRCRTRDGSCRGGRARRVRRGRWVRRRWRRRGGGLGCARDGRRDALRSRRSWEAVQEGVEEEGMKRGGFVVSLCGRPLPLDY